jgi:hypothetical protein
MSDLGWWYLEGDPVYCAVALVAAATVERAVELVIEELRDDLGDPDDPLLRGWHNSADDYADGTPQDANCPAPPGAEGVYFAWTRMPREWPDEELETLVEERERER